MFNVIISNPKNLPTFATNEQTSKIVVEKQSGRVLFSENASVKRPMASTTKILTAITIIENCNLDDYVTVTAESVGVEGSSIYLKLGEKMKVIDLLYGLMLHSGNDAASALAIHSSKTIECFATLMNETAKKIGAVDSHFTNPHGLNDEEHYTTAKDLALITVYALKNETFAKIVRTKRITVENSEGEKRYFVNKNKMLSGFDGADGVKTGFTKVAGRCLVSSATRENMQLICVVLGCPPMFEESKQLLDDCFSKYKNYTLLKNGESVGELSVLNKLADQRFTFQVAPKEDFRYPLTESEFAEVKKEISFINCKKINNIDPVGEIRLSLENDLIYSQKLFIIDEIKELDFFSALKIVLKYW